MFMVFIFLGVSMTPKTNSANFGCTKLVQIIQETPRNLFETYYAWKVQQIGHRHV